MKTFTAEHPASGGEYYVDSAEVMSSPMRPAFTQEEIDREERIKTRDNVKQLLHPPAWMEVIEDDETLANLRRRAYRYECMWNYWLVEVWKPNMLMEDVFSILDTKFEHICEDVGGLLKGLHARIFRLKNHQRILRGKSFHCTTFRVYQFSFH